jgi:photosystem II stability/assembly factor-like uncharacterized protein
MKSPVFTSHKLHLLIFIMSVLCAFNTMYAQTSKSKKAEKPSASAKTGFDTVDIPGLRFRSIGPALTSGRISEFAVDPDDPKRYFVAVSSGGVWRTLNAGNTFEPVFDKEGSFSIGTISMDPHNPNVIWVGTGENNNQRSVAYGDGVYKSVDGGNTWKNMGLRHSEHIGRILIHPGNSDIIYVAAIGPLWSAGGDRGLYRSKDGGKSWENVLAIDEHTGVNDVVMDPRNPDVLYASSFQRRRHVFTYLGGGPQSTIYKTSDGGNTWEKSAAGLPSVDIGRIGMVISPADPEIIYALVEAAMGKGGTFRSTNRGASWEKMSDYHSAGNYYQELVADPVNPEKIYSMDTWMQISNDGGRTWRVLGEDFKHIDNHALWIDPDDTDHLLAGCDGGVYESWDAAKHWHFKANLPVTQFYKVSVDNAEPFYNIYGGTQDNFSLGGPSRTTSANGISNNQWFVTHGGDGFETQVDPHNPNIIFSQSQYGVLVRYDKMSGEEVGIQPHERKGEDAYRWNWDSPLVISRHVPGRIYFAANKLFVSDDRGDNWQVISDDLTRQIDRNKLKVMGRVWSVDAVAKNQSTSPFGNIVAFAESPLDPDLLYVGTDDGLIQVTTDRGKTWRRIDHIAGAPDTSYVNMIIASSHDDDVVYACFNHHKYGDFKPYIFVSHDKGQSWSSISGNLPERGSVYAIAEDHVDPALIFAGTEFSFFVSNNGGRSWKKLTNGLPTIAVKDIEIQRRENDIVLGTFGRGFYVLDDYSPLRNVKDADLAQEAFIMPVRDAFVFESSYPLGLPGKAFQGDSYYRGENLGAQALITFYVKDKIQTSVDKRRKEEEKMIKEGQDVFYPTYDQLSKERDEEKPKLYLVIEDQAGALIRKLPMDADKNGLQRISWDLRTSPKDAISMGSSSFYNPFAGRTEGPLVAPGKYTATLYKWEEELMSPLSAKIPVTVKSLDNKVLPAKDAAAAVAFKRKAEDLSRVQQSASGAIRAALNELNFIRKAITYIEEPEDKWLKEVISIENKLNAIQRQLSGDPLRSSLDIYATPSLSDRISRIIGEGKYSSAEPTGTHLISYEIAREELALLLPQLQEVLEKELPDLRRRLRDAGAPYTPNVIPSLNMQ